MPLSRDELLTNVAGLPKGTVLVCFLPLNLCPQVQWGQTLGSYRTHCYLKAGVGWEGVHRAGMKRGIQLLFPTFPALSREYDMIDSFLGRGRKTSLS